jgi:hypothetical protein
MKFAGTISQRLCALCKQHHAKFTFRGRVKRDKEHDVCHRCYRSLRDRNAARQLSARSNRRAAGFEASSYFYGQLLEQPWIRKVGLA